MRLRKTWTTHMPMLIKFVQLTDGPVMELGAGPFSTPLLHWLCAETRRPLTTYEHDPEYMAFAKGFRSRFHSIRKVETYDDIDIDQFWDVVFVDHSTGRRAIDIIRLKDHAKYIVVHDTESPLPYGYDEIWGHFKYRYDWKFCKPWTSVVSNFSDPNENIQ